MSHRDGMPASYDEDIAREPEYIPLGSTVPAGTHLAYRVIPEDLGTRAEVYISAAYPGGGCAWGFGIQYHQSPISAIQLRMFDDAFAALTDIPDFFAQLPQADTLDGVVELLEELGATDETP